MPSIPSLLIFLLLQTPAAAPDAGGPLARTDYARAFQRGDYAGAAALASDQELMQQERRGAEDLLDPGASPRP